MRFDNFPNWFFKTVLYVSENEIWQKKRRIFYS